MSLFKTFVLGFTLLFSAVLYFLLLLHTDPWKKVLQLRGDFFDYLFLFLLTYFWTNFTKFIWKWELRVLK